MRVRDSRRGALVEAILVCTLALGACGRSVRSLESSRHPYGFVDVSNYGPVAEVTAHYELEGPLELRDVGDCVVSKSPVASAPRRWLDAGTVTISGMSLAVGDDGEYRARRAAFEPEQMVTLDVFGSANVPAHSGQIAFPSALSSPEITNALVVLDRAEGFAPTWTPRPDGIVTVGLTATPNVSGDIAITVLCTASASDGKVMIPSDLLAELPPTSDSLYSTSFVLFHVTETELEEDEWTIRFGAADVQQTLATNIR